MKGNQDGFTLLKVLIVLAIIGLLTFAFGKIFATENGQVTGWGGEMKISIPADNSFAGAFWLDDNLWTTYRKARPSEELPETYTMEEKSSYGWFEGTVTFIESRSEQGETNQSPLP